ncbi:hypothetical protein RFI_33703 [Reticulomyxa filosa]|uniref:Viral A-type inclusion protein n=1 Tax=Reticulomyxa filosa TaxID=46433 RepID=X6LPZ0_RETFI|nr:hypothetical protein RFI_33703 [Reticulomyxa filosa]|eukprot:ETO03699.1 hypothetical protein RFI_33703 [Reticulomyxa filosa]
MEELQNQNKQLENEIRIEKMKSNDSELDRRQSVTTLHNRMFQKLLDAKDTSEEKISMLQARVRELETALMSDERIEGLDQPSSVRSDEHISDNYAQQIRELKQTIKLLELENSTLKQAKHQNIVEIASPPFLLTYFCLSTTNETPFFFFIK